MRLVIANRPLSVETSFVRPYVPEPLRLYFTAHELELPDYLGWAKGKNSAWLTTGEQAGFVVLLSGDQTIRRGQNMVGRKIALVCISDDHWPIVKTCVKAII